ncbi:hypothetical protein ACFWDF_05740 [Streptomyces diastaticus]|uniref:hypothetical protein n=1 Tax=Streptomyces diastaticus TaxID=1956 RepID=UPI00368E05E8
MTEQAHREAQELLTELREVAWRVHPTAPDSLGPREALTGCAGGRRQLQLVEDRLEALPHRTHRHGVLAVLRYLGS